MNHSYTIITEGEEHQVTITPEDDHFIVTLGGVTHRFGLLLDKPPIYSFLVDGSKVLEADIHFKQDHCFIDIGHVPYRVEIFDPRRRLASQAGEGGAGSKIATVEAPMPGKVVDIKVGVGDKVKKDQPVIVIEAMKMQNELLSPIEGFVQEIKIRPADTVNGGQALVIISKEKPA